MNNQRKSQEAPSERLPDPDPGPSSDGTGNSQDGAKEPRTGHQAADRREGGIMSRAGKVYALFGDPADEMSGMVVRAETAGKAKALYEFGCFTTDFTQVRAQRVPWLDDYDDLHGPDALMGMLRHGWWISGVEDPDGELPDEHLTGQDIEKYARRHRIVLESAYEHMADLLGATYPDRYRPDDFGKEEA